jgi:cytochrome b561
MRQYLVLLKLRLCSRSTRAENDPRRRSAHAAERVITWGLIMQWHNSPDRYGAGLLTVHWLMVVLISCGWLIGQLKDATPRDWHGPVQLLHNSAGLLVLLLLVVRLAWRFADPPPAIETSRFGPVATWVAQIAHGALYILMLAVPIAGITLIFAGGHALNIFGLFEIASPWIRDRKFAGSVHEVHELLANALIILAFLHAAAALVHHWALRDQTLRRMLPRRAG